MSEETRIYKKGWKPEAENVAKKFGFVKPGINPNSLEGVRKKRQPSQIEQILVGWGNYVKSRFVELSPELKEMGQKRLEICDPCDMRNGGTCSTTRQGKHVITGQMATGGGCHLAAKALSPGSVCPLGKW